MTLNNKKEVASYFKSDLDNIKAETDKLKAEIANKEKEVNSLYETYISEAEGTKGTMKLGKGPVFKEKIAKHNLASSELDSIRKTNLAKIAINDKKAITLQTDLDKKVTETQPIIDGFDGLMARINALKSIE